MSAVTGIKILMADKELTQAQLSELSGVSQTTISLALSGKVKAQVKTVAKLAVAMGSTYSEVIKLGV